MGQPAGNYGTVGAERRCMFTPAAEVTPQRCVQIIKSEYVTFFTSAGNFSVGTCHTWGEGAQHALMTRFLFHWTTFDTRLSHVSETVNFVMYDVLWSAWISSLSTSLNTSPPPLHPRIWLGSALSDNRWMAF